MVLQVPVWPEPEFTPAPSAPEGCRAAAEAWQHGSPCVLLVLIVLLVTVLVNAGRLHIELRAALVRQAGFVGQL
jgi:hypothetical protein